MTSVFHWQFRRVLPTLSDPELRLIMALNSRTNVRSRCWPSTQQLMEDTGLSRPALVKARKGLIGRGAIELVPYKQRVDDEAELPPRQFVYQLTGKIALGTEVILYLADNHSLGKGSPGEPLKVNAVNVQRGEPKVVTSLKEVNTEEDPRAKKEELGKLLGDIYFKAFNGFANAYTLDALFDAVEDFGIEWLEDALKEAALNNAKSMAYVKAILANWRKEGRKPAPADTKSSPDTGSVPVLLALEDVPPKDDADTFQPTPDDFKAAKEYIRQQLQITEVGE